MTTSNLSGATVLSQAISPCPHSGVYRQTCPLAPHLCCSPAADTELLDILHGWVQVHFILGTRLPPLILSLEVLA